MTGSDEPPVAVQRAECGTQARNSAFSGPADHRHAGQRGEDGQRQRGEKPDFQPDHHEYGDFREGQHQQPENLHPGEQRHAHRELAGIMVPPETEVTDQYHHPDHDGREQAGLGSKSGIVARLRRHPWRDRGRASRLHSLKPPPAAFDLR